MHNSDKIIYLDNAATSWPKPPQVLKAMNDVLERAGGNPGRSGHRLSIEAARAVYNTREAVASLFNAADPLRVIFTLNATHAINYVLSGLLKPGDRVVTTSMEHNAVMRPLRALEKNGITVTVVQCSADGVLQGNDIASALNIPARLVVINHASNIIGTIAPIAEISRITHSKGALVLVDAAQTAGVIPIDMKELGIDFLAFTGHKGLQGPPGTGGLIIGDIVDSSILKSLVYGGTGSNSSSEEQPDSLPDKYESGTTNLPGIAGLGAGIAWILEKTLESVRSHEINLMKRLYQGLAEIKGVTVFGNNNPEQAVAVMSFTIKNQRVSDIGLRLDEEFDILTRVGLHCAPAAHRTIGTFPDGTVRLAPGFFTSLDDIDKTILAVKAIAGS